MGSSVGGSLDSRAQDTRYPPFGTDPATVVSDRGEKAKAISLQQRLVSVLHDKLSGLPGLVSRGAKPWQLALRGVPGRPITLRDLAELATHPAREARAAIHDLALELLEAVRPADGTLLGEALATLSREFGELVGEHAKAIDDGKVNLGECDRLLREAAEHQRALTVYTAALQAHRRRLAS